MQLGAGGEQGVLNITIHTHVFADIVDGRGSDAQVAAQKLSGLGQSDGGCQRQRAQPLQNELRLRQRR